MAENLPRRVLLECALAAAGAGALSGRSALSAPSSDRPNIVFIHTDDQRHDAMSCAGNQHLETPAMDSLAARGVRFTRAFVATSICSPSRACCFTGRYGSLNGVQTVPGNPLNPGETTFVDVLKRRGYQTGFVGKWHLSGPKSPVEAGYDFASYFRSNGAQWNRRVIEGGEEKAAAGFIEDYIAGQAIRFLETAARRSEPFLLHYCTQIPHMDHEFQWRPKQETLDRYYSKRPPLPESWKDDLAGKPEYLKTSRSIAQARLYGYHNASRVIAHLREYCAVIHDMDAALGRFLQAMDALGVRDDTYVIVMGDNGWFLGEHRFTSKVLAYEESIRVPLLIAGPGVKPQVREDLALNADIAPTILDLCDAPLPSKPNGRSLKAVLEGGHPEWRGAVYYQSLKESLGVWPLEAVRNSRWKYIRTYQRTDPSRLHFEELYDLESDPAEMANVMAAHPETAEAMRAELERLRSAVAAERVV